MDMEDSDNIAILTLPYSNDLSTLYSNTNNLVVLILIAFQCILLVLQLLTVYLLPRYYHNNWQYSSSNSSGSGLLDSYALSIYSQIILWLIILLIRYYLLNVYYKRLRVLGYQKHHQLVSRLASVPSLVLHKTNALLLLITTLLCKYNDKIIIGNGIQLTPINIIQIVMTSATIIILAFLSRHMWHELRFRKQRNPPDIFCVDDPNHLQYAGLNQIGVRSVAYHEDLLEKQADLIYNLKLQNSHMRAMLYKVSQQRSALREQSTHTTATN